MRVAYLGSVIVAAVGFAADGCTTALGPARAVPVTRTRVHVVTPFRSSGELRAGLSTKTVSGACYPASQDPESVGFTDVYTCDVPPVEACPRNCKVDMCWRDYRSLTLSMVCLFSPYLGLDDSALRVTVTNHPRASVGVKDPLATEPWAFEFSNGENCIASVTTRGPAPSRLASLSYACGQGSTFLYPEPGARIDRSRPLWTLKVALSLQQDEARDYTSTASITDAWFAGNNHP